MLLLTYTVDVVFWLDCVIIICINVVIFIFMYMSMSRSYGTPARLVTLMFLTSTLMLIELVVGYITNSTVLIAGTA